MYLSGRQILKKIDSVPNGIFMKYPFQPLWENPLQLFLRASPDVTVYGFTRFCMGKGFPSGSALCQKKLICSNSGAFFRSKAVPAEKSSAGRPERKGERAEDVRRISSSRALVMPT